MKNFLRKETIIDLASRKDERFLEFASKIEDVPFYDKIYHVTYGQYLVDVNFWVSLLKTLGKVKDCSFLEVFGGSGIEAGILAGLFPRNIYASVDIDATLRKFQKFSNVRYLDGDCVFGFPEGKWDVIYGGVLNDSHNSILTEVALESHLRYVKDSLNHRGVFLFSAGHFSEAPKESFWIQGVNFGQYSNMGIQVLVYSYVDKDAYTGILVYNNACIMLDKSGEFLWGGVSHGEFRYWDIPTVIWHAKRVGLRLIGDTIKKYSGVLVFS